MNITVYCGALTGKDPEFTRRAEELGAWMAKNGHRLVYGGGNAGMMGAIAGAVHREGGHITGVTPDFFIFAEEILDLIDDLRVTKDMAERRQIMMDEGDAFIALPGGSGTLDEISEVIALRRLGMLGETDKPIMLYNINGYYDHLLQFFDRMTGEEFNRPIDRAGIYEVCSVEDIENVLESAGRTFDERITLYSGKTPVDMSDK